MPLHPSEVGNRIIQACLYLLPCDDGDEAFRWITKDWGRKGTTCGFLVAACMWLVGVRSKIVNRDADGTKYTVGGNVSRVFNGGRHPFTFHKGDMRPEPGAVVFISNGPPNTEHVCIFWKEEGDFWWTFDGGQSSGGKECMRACKRRYTAGALGGRKVVGYIQPTDMPLSEEEIDVVHLLSAAWAERPQRDLVSGKPV